MRPSSYNILVNVDKENDLYAIINGYTYTFDIVNKEVYQYLKDPSDAPPLSDRTTDKLVRRGYLTSLSEEEERELIKRITDKQHENARLKQLGFYFIMSYECNLRCIYCYENEVLNGCGGLPSKKLHVSKLIRLLRSSLKKYKTIRVPDVSVCMAESLSWKKTGMFSPTSWNAV